jgi:hypothetical protein
MIADLLLHVFKLRMTGDRCLDFTTPQGLHSPNFGVQRPPHTFL